MSDTLRFRVGENVLQVQQLLSLPADEQLVLRLSAKLYEYRQRLLRPDLDSHRAISTHYKIWVLQQLLDRKSLEFMPLRKVVADENKNDLLSLAYFLYAWKVIENYCTGHGQSNIGGTGLPDYWQSLESGLRQPVEAPAQAAVPASPAMATRLVDTDSQTPLASP